MKRLVFLCALIALPGFAADVMIWGQTAVTPPTDKKPKETVQSDRVVKDESWYSIIANGEKIGSIHTVITEITVSPTGTAAVQKSYLLLREAVANKPDVVPYLKLSEEIQFASPDMTLQKSILKMSLADKRDVTIKGVKEGTGTKFATTVLTPSASGGEPVSQTTVQEFTGNENFYSEQTLGFLLIANNWAKQSPLKLISPYSPNNLLVDAQLFIKERTSQKIMDVMTEGYLCSLTIMDPLSSVESIEYFIGLDGIVLKQNTVTLAINKTVKNESEIQDSSKKVFERRGRKDPFEIRLTPAAGEKTKGGGADIAKKPPENQSEKLILAYLTEAREQLQQMKDIYDKAPADKKDELLAFPYQRILELHQKVYEMKDLNAKSQMDEIRDEAERLFAGAEKISIEAGYIRNDAKKDFELRNFKEIPKKLGKITELSERKEVKNTEYASKIKVMVDEVAELTRRAKIIEEFFVTRPVINGIIYYIKSEEVKLPPMLISFLGCEIALPVSYFKQIPASSIMIANKVYKEGDKVSDDLLIKTIQPNTVLFNYKNEEISLEYKGK